MSDEMIGILKDHLAFKDEVIRAWMMDLVSFCQHATTLQQAREKLLPLLHELSSSIDFIGKVPYCCLLLSCAYYRWDNLSSAADSAQDAIRGFGNGAEEQNHAVALWLHGLVNEKAGHIEEARRDLGNATKLIEREVEDCKRRGKCSQQKKYQRLLFRLRETENRLGREFHVQWVVP